MAARKFHPIRNTNLVLQSVYQSLPVGLIEPKYALTLAALINQGSIENTPTNDYTTFVIAIIGAEAFDTTNDTVDTEFNSSKSGQNIYKLFEEYILNVIQSITQGITLDTVLSALTPLQTQINTATTAASAILVIQNVMIILLNNVQSNIDIAVIQKRLDYLQSLLTTETDLDPIYAEINTFITTVIDLVAKKEPYADLVEQLTNTLLLLQNANIKEIQYVDDIVGIQQVLLGVIQNITDRVDLGLVKNRLAYVQRLLDNVPTL